MDVSKMTNAELLFAYDHYDEQHHGDIRAEILRLMDRGRLEHGQGALGVGAKLQGTITHWQPAPPEQPQGNSPELIDYAQGCAEIGKMLKGPERHILEQVKQAMGGPAFCSDPDCNTCKAEKEKLNEQSAGLADRGEPYRYEHHWTAPIFSKPADPARGQQFPNEASFAKMQELVTRAAQPQMSARKDFPLLAELDDETWEQVLEFAEAFARSQKGERNG